MVCAALISSSHISIGLSVAQATSVALHNLNEHPEVLYVEAGWKSTDRKLYGLSAIVVSLSYLDFSLDEVVRLSNLARTRRIGFFVVSDSLSLSCVFSDMGELHVVEEYTAPVKRDERTGERQTETKREEFEFVDFKGFLDNLDQIPPKWMKRHQKRSGVLANHFLFLSLFLKYKNEGKNESSPKRVKIASLLPASTSFEKFLRVELLGGSFSLSEENQTILVEVFSKMFSDVSTPASPEAAAILGALASQEIIKYITKRDPPLVNVILLNPGDCSAVVEKCPVGMGYRLIQPAEAAEVEEVKGAGIDVIE